MPYVSAKYVPNSPIAPPGSPRQIQATDDQGNVWSLTEDSQVGDWLRYLEEGGTIEAMDTQPTEPQPKPSPSPSPTEVPQAQPEVVYGEPLPE
jgi:hypothetical protein